VPFRDKEALELEKTAQSNDSVLVKVGQIILCPSLGQLLLTVTPVQKEVELESTLLFASLELPTVERTV
jgi:hypothetical protein